MIWKFKGERQKTDEGLIIKIKQMGVIFMVFNKCYSLIQYFSQRSVVPRAKIYILLLWHIQK